MMDELQSPSSNKKRNIAATDSLPGPKRRLTKKMKIITGDALSHSSSKTPSNNPPVIPSNRTPRIPPVKNSKAGPSTKSSATSQSRDTITPTRMSSRTSRPTLKKKAQLFERRSRSPESDGTPPSSIIPPAPPPSLKRKKPTSSPIKRFGNNIPSKCKRIDPNPIELTSDDDAQPPKKRVKRTQKKRSSYEVIDLCSENEDITSSPKPTRTRDEEPAVLVLSTDDDMDIELLSFNHPAFGENTRKSPSLPPLGNISPPAQDEPLLQTLPSPRTHNTPVPKPKTLAAEEDVTTDENIYAENFPRGSLQALYNDALARVSRESWHADIVDQPSPFLSLNCTPPARVIRHSTQSRPPTLHTPLFFDRMILRLKARLKPKTLDAKAFSDTTEQGNMALNNVMESSDVDNVAPEVVTKITLVAPIDFPDTYTQAAHVSPCILVHDLNISERAVFKAPDSPLPLVNQESPLPSETVILEDTPMFESIQIQEVPVNHKAATPESANSPLISLNMSSNAPSSLSNPDVDDYKIETPHEDQVATIEPSVLKDAQLLVQSLRRRYGSKTSGSLLLPALESNNKVVPQSLSESSVRSMEHATTTNASFPANSSSKDTSLTSRCLSESPMIRTDNTTILDVPPNITSRPENTLSASKFSATPTIILTEQAMTLNSLASSGSQNASPSSECLSDSPAIATQHATALNPYSLSASSNNADTLSSHNSSPSAPSRQVSDSSASIESVNCHLVTPDNSPSPLTPPINTQKQEPAIRLDRNSSLPNLVSFFDMDLSKLNLRTLMGNSRFDEGGEDSDDDDISISGMELLYPEEII